MMHAYLWNSHGGCSLTMGEDKNSSFFSVSVNGTLMVQELSTTCVINHNREFFRIIRSKQWKNLKMCHELFVTA